MKHAGFLLVVWFSLAICSAARAANEANGEQLYDIDIPSLNAAEALNRLAEQTGAIMLFPYDLAEARQANAVSGRYTLMAALSEMLKDSGLSSGLSDKRVIQIALDEPVERKKKEGEMVTAKVPITKKVGAFVASLFVASGVSAQDSANAESVDVPATLEEVVVTGSRLRRDGFNVSTPLVTIDSEALQDTGLGSLAEVLIDEIPSLYESTSNTNSQSSVSQTGLSTINLRQLGSNRTLTLIDGRRTVPNSYSGNYISLSTIPNALIERVEIITGGSTATYGSDAVAGVVNIITQQSRKGFGFDARTGFTPENGGEEFTVNTDFGADFNNERGYLFFGASYDRQYGIDWQDRRRGAQEVNFEYDTELMCNAMGTETGTQCMRDITRADWRDRSDGTAGGVFDEGSGGVGGFYYDENGLQTDWVEERDGLFSRIWDVVKIPDERLSTALKVDYELTDKTRAYFQVQYSQSESFNFKSPEDENESSDVTYVDPTTGEPGEVSAGRISINNPFAPPEIVAQILLDDPDEDEFNWDRRFFEVGNITTDNRRKTIRSWAGLQGGMFNDEWQWDVSVGYGTFDQVQRRSNELNVVKLEQALDAELAPDGVTIQCRDPEARAEGCVPLNLFGVGSITPEMADWIRANPTINTDLEQINALAFISGDLFDMPAGPVAVVFGMEARRDSLDLRTSEGHQNGGITFNIVPAFSGDVDVAEVFGEASFPLAQNLSADVSLRLADYSPEGIDTIVSHSTGLMWEPIEGYNLRANYARAQRAPTLTELRSPPRGDFDSYTDICDEVTATSTEQGHDNCRLDPLVAAVIAADGVFEDDNNSYSPNVGNEILFEETADTYTVGFSIAPGFLDGFRLAVDYYDITIEDAIDSFENTEILKQCYASSIPFGDPNPFCDDITRDSDGNVIEILQRDFNLNESSTSGFDMTLEYTFDLGRYGSLQLDGNYTHISEHETVFAGNDGLVVTDFNNQLDTGIFKDVARASLTWRTENWRVRWRTKFQGSIVDSQERVDEYRQLLVDNDDACAIGSDDCVANPEVPKFLFYPSYIRHDLSLAYDMELSNGAGLRLSGGVRNIFDDQGPFVPRNGDNFESGIGNFDSAFDGGIGRFLYVGAALRFDD